MVTTAADLSEIDPYIVSRMTDLDLSRVLEVGSHVKGLERKLGGVPEEMLAQMTFQTFDTRGNNSQEHYRKSLEAAFQASQDYADNPDGWLCIFGSTGVGKTHFAVAIASVRLRKQLPVAFFTVPKLLDHLRHTFEENSGFSYSSEFEKLQNAPLLILDELGIEHRTDWGYEKLYQLIVYRHDLRLPTVITTQINLYGKGNIGTLSKIETGRDASILSRMNDSSVVQLVPIDARDYRSKKKRR